MASRKLAPQTDPTDVKRRLVIVLGHMYPDRTEFSMAEVMEALGIMQEVGAR